MIIIAIGMFLISLAGFCHFWWLLLDKLAGYEEPYYKRWFK